ncbi:hypothetical protein BYT27DRAFT_7258350 [Phlegmacium glaucopus]|nr:hypothetical protein BYT27DRAFT_7258350 [Phlegmacium glaucopus]
MPATHAHTAANTIQTKSTPKIPEVGSIESIPASHTSAKDDEKATYNTTKNPENKPEEEVLADVSSEGNLPHQLPHLKDHANEPMSI